MRLNVLVGVNYSSRQPPPKKNPPVIGPKVAFSRKVLFQHYSPATTFVGGIEKTLNTCLLMFPSWAPGSQRWGGEWLREPREISRTENYYNTHFLCQVSLPKHFS